LLPPFFAPLTPVDLCLTLAEISPDIDDKNKCFGSLVVMLVSFTDWENSGITTFFTGEIDPITADPLCLL